MSQTGQQNGKEPGSAAHIQNVQFSSGRNLRTDFSKPAICQRTVKFPPPLVQEAVASFSPIFCDPYLPVVVIFHNPPVGNNRSILKYLQRTGTVQHHTVALRPADFHHFAVVISYFSQDIAFLNHITWIFKGIPKARMPGDLVTDVCHIQRIIGAVIFLTVIDSQMAENIAHITAGGGHFLCRPLPHAAPFKQYTGNTAGCCIVIHTAGRHIGPYHIGHVHLLRHLPRNVRYLRFSHPCIIDIGRQPFIVVSAVQIDQIICRRIQLLRDGPGQLLHLCTLRISRKHPVQILMIFVSQAAAAMFKGRTIDYLNKDHRTRYFLRFQHSRQFHRRLDTHIFAGMDACRNQHCLSRFHPVENRCRQPEFPFGQFQISAEPFPRLYIQIQQMIRSICRPFLSGTDHKHGGGTIIQFLFFAPDTFPDIFIRLHGFHIQLF